MEAMHRQTLASLLTFSVAALGTSIEIPTGTQIQIRLTTTIDSKLAKAKQPFEAIVIAPVLVGGRFAIPQGTHLSGLIQDAKSSKKPDEQSVTTLVRSVWQAGARAHESAVEISKTVGRLALERK